jgi:hypothetical protein
LSSRSVTVWSLSSASVLAGLRGAHDDAALQLVEVEGVHRLAEFEQQVVGDVDAASMLRRPQRRSFSCSHRGLGRVRSTPSITRHR